MIKTKIKRNVSDDVLQKLKSKFLDTYENCTPYKDCILWPGPFGKHKFPVINSTKLGGVYSAIRLSYRCFVNEILDDHVVTRSCSLRECVNPEHLKLEEFPQRAKLSKPKGVYRKKFSVPDVLMYQENPDAISVDQHSLKDILNSNVCVYVYVIDNDIKEVIVSCLSPNLEKSDYFDDKLKPYTDFLLIKAIGEILEIKIFIYDKGSGSLVSGNLGMFSRKNNYKNLLEENVLVDVFKYLNKYMLDKPDFLRNLG